ncbi:oxidoreductase [Carnobacterium divergens]|uniref:Gfo/Idh/MocA family protein n=1 Tax=Carnobacterium divergens TaxID=2748 RepID=UPI0010725C05|nr:Gfo/Idh/MocA family oxidoreductase [Carnobacterium divergens]TFI68467.1 oxidoreductase [Carnobacterium divergens]TFI68664.1 oxidoreductase [Carnobacterium divergens]TFI83657.1 oxidoreductase [Carnobacterium divergens]TFJ09735.1 oxidoreductase [Carnobacterium divergens]TFJ14615.1 oxidoreductase [Carnobacterium divergens]
MKTVNWAILGLGDIASSFATSFKAPNATLYAAGSRSLEKAKAFTEKHQIENAYGNYDELLNDQAIDIVYIATPHSHHYDLIMKSLQAGKHVLCEKAITMNGTQLKAAMDLASEKHLILSEAMTIYHMPLYHKLKELVDGGTIGKLKMLQVSFGSLRETDPTNRFYNKALAGGALLDIGTYALSFTRFFLNSQPHEILTTMNLFETGVDEQSGIILKNKDNEMAVVSLTFRAKMPKRGIIACEDGYITVDDYPRATSATLTRPDGKTELIEAGNSGEALNYEATALTDWILANKKDPFLPLSYDVLTIMDTVRERWGLHYDFE